LPKLPISRASRPNSFRPLHSVAKAF
jgi:hypothetical protein